MSSLQWILIAILCGAVEIFSSGFWFLWLAIAALLVAGAAAIGILTGLPAQLLIFSIITLVLIVFTRPLLMKTIKSNDTVSNVKALIGQQGIALTPISPLNFGQVKVNGEIWTATSKEYIEENIRVVVIGVDGVKLVVDKAFINLN
ncbi:MAG TPA: NfeD family protein [Syntrophomonadaceae bacterium]|jgi:membrane protein implicated in regulation of membrane protease activity|nr:NfeD family protein [Syntrophomonadaceae bacterium]